MQDEDEPPTITRRAVLEAGAATTVLIATGLPASAQHVSPSVTAEAVEPIAVKLKVNMREWAVRLDARTSLLDALRNQLGLMGTKKGCDHGQCGACTVLVNGSRINSCLTLAVMHDGDEITSIEGVAARDRLHPLQSAFIEYDAFQCGFCTSGQICSALGMFDEIRAGWPSRVTEDLTMPALLLNDAEIRERMSGNLCRCAAYPNIVAAIRSAAGSAAV